MNALLGAIVGVLAGAGAWIAIAGIVGVRVRERAPLVVDWSRVGLRAGVVAVAWVLSWAVTGWPMAGVIGAAIAMTIPMLVSARAARAAASAKTEALAAWAEMLRDTISGHAGLNQAIAVTADVAPEPVRVHVRALAVRAERHSLSAALRAFATDVADPVADLIVAALVIADERQARDLTRLLSEIASSARQQAAMRMRVETGRARTYAQSQALVGITLMLVIVLLLFSPEFLEPYDSLAGQLVLAVIGALFAAALAGLVRLGRPVDTPRLLAGIEEGGVAMMLLLMTFAGALAGAGLLLIARGLSVSATPLATVVEDLHRVREHSPVRRTRLDALVEAAAGRALRDRQSDLAVCERSSSKFVQDRLVWALIGATPAMAFLALTTTQVLTIFPPGLLVAGLLAGAVVGWFYALVDLTSDAKKARREFRHALASYLELVTILMAGGAGTETALYDAAAIGRGSAFRQMRSALSAAQARREAPWLSLGALGRRVGVTELTELEASITLAGQGARVRESLMAKAESMRLKDLADLESEAQARSETMVLPVALMFAGFMLLIGYPALAGLSGP